MNTTSDDLILNNGSTRTKRDNHYQKLEKRLKTSRETRELLLRSPAPGAHPMETHLTCSSLLAEEFRLLPEIRLLQGDEQQTIHKQ
ncbi:hypothetical protein OUZ56_017260 [Daphnia magna]|uniref:Uncharacterized protein n=1 Tax=Daphnia magna TaxID=35525 RepID=A0ABR0ASI4_9CRUS|nr:hypothetical protein OUZ56_017260 [Daphnia magna]